MADSNDGLRQRGNKTASNNTSKTRRPGNEDKEKEDSTDELTAEDRAFQPLDILRVLVIITGFCFATSFYLTSGNSIIFNYSPWFTNPRALALWWNGGGSWPSLNLTLDQLAQYDGSDPDPKKPIYLAINGSIFDVTAGRRTYGPGGSYNVFAGRDATRAFITGCFLEDTTSDMRGAELIYLPVEDVDPQEEGLTSAERKLRAEREKREAKKRVVQGVQGWVDFYRNSDKYFEVGRVVGTPTGVPDGPAPTLCEEAEKGRPRRSQINENNKSKQDKDKEAGKPVR